MIRSRQISLTLKIDFHLVGSPGEGDGGEQTRGGERWEIYGKSMGDLWEICGMDAEPGWTVELPRSASS